MDTACDGCQNKHKGKDDLSNGSSKHVCKCRSRDETITIDPGLDQAAASPGDELKASTGKGRPDTAQYQEELKSRIIQSI